TFHEWEQRQTLLFAASSFIPSHCDTIRLLAHLHKCSILKVINELHVSWEELIAS
ncbi:hypothetical protein ACLOJK_003378, partial [Asimina triloba]